MMIATSSSLIKHHLSSSRHPPIIRMIFRALPERLSDAEIDEMLRAADTDGNSQLLRTEKCPILNIAVWLLCGYNC